MTDFQQKIFEGGEGDAWYRRNREHLGRASDRIVRIVSSIAGRESMTSVCELGCANGWRLTQLRPMFSAKCFFAGMDASRDAVGAGQKQFTELDLRHGVLSDVPYAQPFDLVIVNFVLHWIDRDLLARCAAEIDRVVKWNGYLVLGDFLPDFPVKRRYHHLPEQAVFTYKQDYARIFLGYGFYNEIVRETFSHDQADAGPDVKNSLGHVDADARAFVSLLHKSPLSYVER